MPVHLDWDRAKTHPERRAFVPVSRRKSAWVTKVRDRRIMDPEEKETDIALAKKWGIAPQTIYNRRAKLRREQKEAAQAKGKYLAQDFLRKTGRLPQEPD
ncbi:MAG: hypothetical protein Q7S26_00520 [bacterium]|nr:hypothetical protein [bacterium]